MAGKEQERVFVEGILGRRWDNFASRVAAVNYHRLFLHQLHSFAVYGIEEKLLRLISKEDLDKVRKAHEKLVEHSF